LEVDLDTRIAMAALDTSLVLVTLGYVALSLQPNFVFKLARELASHAARPALSEHPQVRLHELTVLSTLLPLLPAHESALVLQSLKSAMETLPQDGTQEQRLAQLSVLCPQQS